MTKIPNNLGSNQTNYFEERNKGEMNELKKLLNTVINQNDIKKGKQVVKKVIGFMTIGMDTSPVFSEMCRASFFNDQVIKKMIYFYLTTNAEDNTNLAIMAINTFKKDCKHSSDKIRGLALRNLCSFRSADYVNTVLPIIRSLLQDPQPYVRKTAILGVLKVFYHQPVTIFNDTQILKQLSQLIKDDDNLVSTNAIITLNEILISQGGIPFTTKLFFYILKRLRQYSDWQQSVILEILYRYEPINQKQSFQILNILWQKLKHSSTPLVLASIHIILKLTKNKPELFENVISKIKSPLLTLMSGNQNTNNFQTKFIVLQHIAYVINQLGGKKQYQKDFKQFYCKIDEPTYIKSLKVKILGNLANEYNLGDMLNQLNDYATEIDIEIARQSVRTLAQISLQLPDVSRALMINMITFYKIEKQHLVNQSIICFYIMLRRYPELFNQIKNCILEYQYLIKQKQAIISFLWILGTFATKIPKAPYIVQEYLNNQNQFDSFDSSIKQVLLNSTIKIFLKRPPQTYNTLNRLFKFIFKSQNTTMTLMDHTAFYYRALKYNVLEVQRNFQIMSSNQILKYEKIQNHQQHIFNTLCIIYNQNENKFTKNYGYFLSMRNRELGLIEPLKDEIENILDLKDEQQQQQQLQIKQLESQDLQNDINLTVEQFQQLWNNYQQQQIINNIDSNEFQFQICNQENYNQDSVEELFNLWYINTMASSQQNNGILLKFFLFGKYTHFIFCIKMEINKQNNFCSICCKSKSINLAKAVNQYIHNFLVLNQLAKK